MKLQIAFAAALAAAAAFSQAAAPAAAKPARPASRFADRSRLPGRATPDVVTMPFGKTSAGEEAHLYRVMGRGGMVMDFSDHGARVVRVYAPDRNGNLADVTCGFNDVSGYEKYDRNFCATIGRFGNRIAGGKFTLDGKEYQLPLNWERNGQKCCLHGGTNAVNFRVWKATTVRKPRAVGVRFTITSEDGDQGFPGKLVLSVTHTLSDQNVWKIEYAATVEGKACPLNLTNHIYFNLKGMGNGDVNDHELTIFSDQITPVDAGMIPTGKFMDVTGTPFDFREPHLVGERINADHEQLKLARGYDHNWVLAKKNAGELERAAVLREASTGRSVEVWTTEPGLQVYGGNVMSGGEGAPKPVPGKVGGTLPWRGGIALETQHYPDSPNHPEFPDTVLRPGGILKSVTEFRFGTFR